MSILSFRGIKGFLWVVMPEGDFSDNDWEDEDVIEMPDIPKVKRSEKAKNDDL